MGILRHLVSLTLGAAAGAGAYYLLKDSEKSEEIKEALHVDELKEKASAFAEEHKDTIETVKTKLQSAAESAATAASAVVEDVKKAVNEKFGPKEDEDEEDYFADPEEDYFTETAEAAEDAAKEACEEVKEAAENACEEVKEAVENAVEEAKEAVEENKE